MSGLIRLGPLWLAIALSSWPVNYGELYAASPADFSSRADQPYRVVVALRFADDPAFTPPSSPQCGGKFGTNWFWVLPRPAMSKW